MATHRVPEVYPPLHPDRIGSAPRQPRQHSRDFTKSYNSPRPRQTRSTKKSSSWMAWCLCSLCGLITWVAINQPAVVGAWIASAQKTCASIIAEVREEAAEVKTSIPLHAEAANDSLTDDIDLLLKRLEGATTGGGKS